MSLGVRIIELKKKGLTYRAIQKELNCAMSTISYHCKNAGVFTDNSNRKPPVEEICSWQALYDKGLPINKIAEEVGWCNSTIRLYVKTKKVTLTTEEKRKLNVSRVLEKRRDTKRRLVEYKGGKCEKCGYNKCISALEFHHINPLEKEYVISKVSNSFEKLKKEADKCQLVCANCHREIEEEIRK